MQEIKNINYVEHIDIAEGCYYITGATGTIGSLLIRSMIHSDAYQRGKIDIYALVRNLNKAKTLFDKEDTSRLHYIVSDITDLNCCIPKDLTHMDYLIHCAAVTTSKLMIEQPVETADAIVLGTRNILTLAKRMNIKSMVYLSSMEIYGDLSGDVKVTEESLGHCKLLDARSCYPLGKQLAENYCYSFWKEYKIPVKIARLAQTFGMGITKDDHRVYAQFIRAILRHEDIILHTRGGKIGNYIASSDAIRAIFVLLNKGTNGEAYNVVNEKNTMTIKEMAEMAASLSERKDTKVIVSLDQDNQHGYAPDSRYFLVGDKLRDLGFAPEKDMKQMLIETMQTIECNEWS
jgi:nucleoside-diphosphate-sugar epimerase